MQKNGKYPDTKVSHFRDLFNFSLIFFYVLVVNNLVEFLIIFKICIISYVYDG